MNRKKILSSAVAWLSSRQKHALNEEMILKSPKISIICILLNSTRGITLKLRSVRYWEAWGLYHWFSCILLYEPGTCSAFLMPRILWNDSLTCSAICGIHISILDVLNETVKLLPYCKIDSYKWLVPVKHFEKHSEKTLYMLSPLMLQGSINFKKKTWCSWFNGA